MLRKIFSYKFFILFLIIAVFFPFLKLGEYWTHVVLIIFVYAILAYGYSLLTGYAGQLAFVTAGFFGLGGYTSGLLAVHFGLSPWLGILLGGAVAGMFSLLCCLPALRLKGPYLALSTLGFVETVRVIMNNWTDVTHGPLGLLTPHFPGIPFSRMNYYYLALSLLAVAFVVFYQIGRSKLGMMFKAIRDDEILAEGLGINVVYYKALAFVITGFICGMAGSFYTHYIGIITPDDLSNKLTITTISMTMVGGIGSNFGPLIGAFVIQLLGEYLRLFGVLYDLIAVGIAIMVTMLFFPGGIMRALESARRAFGHFLTEPDEARVADPNHSHTRAKKHKKQ